VVEGGFYICVHRDKTLPDLTHNFGMHGSAPIGRNLALLVAANSPERRLHRFRVEPSAGQSKRSPPSLLGNGLKDFP
jgi:hypothetical protein